MTDAPNTSKPAFPTHIVRRIRHKALGAEERFVLFVLADHMKSTTDRVWPSVSTIAQITNYNERTVRRVIKWLVSAGILVEFEDGRASRTFGIDFELLGNLPSNLEARASIRALVPGCRTLVPPDRTTVPVHMERTLVPPPLSPSPNERTLVPVTPDPGTGKGIRKEPGKEPVKEPNSARGAAQVGTPVGPLFESQTCQPDFKIDVSIPAPPTALPATSEPSPESLPIPTSRSASSPLPVPAKRGRKRKDKSAGEVVAEKTIARPSGLTEAQSKAFREVTDCFVNEFKKEKGESPMLDYGGRDRKVIQQFLEKCNWDASKACEIIRNAFSQTFFREKLCGFGELLKNTTHYQGKPKSNSRPAYTHNHNAPTQQMEPADWVPSANTMEDFYS